MEKEAPALVPSPKPMVEEDNGKVHDKEDDDRRVLALRNPNGMMAASSMLLLI